MKVGGMLIFTLTSRCLECGFLVVTHALDLAQGMDEAIRRHERFRVARNGHRPQMKLINFYKDDVQYFGSAHAACPMCKDEDPKLNESGDMLVYECGCGHMWLGCRLCHNPMIHPNHDFVFTCEVCHETVDYSRQEGRG